MSKIPKTKTSIDTVTSRTEIGFPSRQGWLKATAKFTDETLRIAGHPVMEAWEQEYMERLADIAASRGGSVLEVGYGLGLSANAIVSSASVQKHYVIECHPDVVLKAVNDLKAPIAQQRTNILQGFWEELTPILGDGIFDGILFDTYPLTEEEIHSNHFWFFKEAYRLLKPGGILTYYSDEVLSFSPRHRAKLQEAGFKEDDIRHELVSVSPPEDCEYWQHGTIVAPIVSKS